MSTNTKKKRKPALDLDILNPDQRAAFGKLVNYIKTEDNHVHVLKGWAGTGKTFCVSLLVKYVIKELYSNSRHYKIAVTGPTNKSVRVLKQTSGLKHHRITFQTIHRLLGLKERITNDGRQEFVNENNNKSEISKISLLIIDEVSMLNDDLFEKILEYRGKLKIICMGDPAQIPPVGRPDCIPFRAELAEDYRIRTLELKTIMRQKEDNPIIKSSIMIRENLNHPVPIIPPITLINEEGEGIEFLNLNSAEVRKEFSKLLEKYFGSQQFRLDSEYVKIIAWRNKTVNTMNDLIRKVIYGEKSKNSKILPGEKLIANNPIMFHDTILFNTNDEFTVESYVIHTEPYQDDLGKSELKFYETNIRYIDDNGELKKETIDILHEDSQSEFDRIAMGLKRRAIEMKGKNKSWLDYYGFLRTYADVNFAYSITAHKSQGSTYNTVFLMEDDIDMNHKRIERNRIKYTAYTRASKKVYIARRF